MMPKTLNLAPGLSLPLEFVTQACAILAKRRVGKSFTARRIVEQLILAGQQVVIIDPKGDWWGIRSAADGEGPGMSVTIFGGEHGDVPLNADAGELVARIAVEEQGSMLLDLSELRKHEVATFMTAFLETLYRMKAREAYRTPVMVVVDEGDAIAPQKPQPNEARMLGAAEDLVRRGGQRGIGTMFITQRSAVLNKNVLTQVQVLIALRTIAPQDLKAMDEWIDVHGEPGQRKLLMASLPSLPVGHAWVWSPGWPTAAGIFQRVEVPPIETFDSGATPKPGERRVEPKLLVPFDLDRIRDLVAAAPGERESNDPKALRKRIAELEHKLNASTVPMPELVRVEVPVVNQAAVESFSRAFQGLYRASQAFEATVASALKDAQEAIEQASVVTPPGTWNRETVDAFNRAEPRQPSRAPVVHRDAKPSKGAAALPKAERQILTALAQHGPLSLTQAAIICGYSSKSGGMRNAAGALRSLGYASGGNDELAITAAGKAALGRWTPLPTGRALAEHWYGQLPKAEREILAIVVAAYPREVPLKAAAERCGYSVSSGGVRNAAGKLRTLDLVEGGNDGMRANERLIDR